MGVTNVTLTQTVYMLVLTVGIALKIRYSAGFKYVILQDFILTFMSILTAVVAMLIHFVCWYSIREYPSTPSF